MFEIIALVFQTLIELLFLRDSGKKRAALKEKRRIRKEQRKKNK